MRWYLKELILMTAVSTIASMFIAFIAISPTDRSFSPKLVKDLVDRGSRLSLLEEHRKQLFEKAVQQNRSRLNHCDIHERTFTFTDVKSNAAVSYRLLVPGWQRGERRRAPYFLSAVARLRLYTADKARWTAAELKQWIHYQLWAGADHVYICNHFLEPAERVAGNLTRFSQAGLVTVIDWDHIKADPASDNYQRQNTYNQEACYNHVLEKWGDQSVWMYTFDMDENPYCPKDQCEGFLRRYLQTPSNPTEAQAGLFLLENYVLMGQGDRSRDIHYDRINRITPLPFNGNVKSIFKANWTVKAEMHGARLRSGTVIRPAPSALRLLHYWGARSQGWGPDTPETLGRTVEFNDVRETLAIAVRHSMLAFGELDGFSNSTGP